MKLLRWRWAMGLGLAALVLLMLALLIWTETHRKWAWKPGSSFTECPNCPEMVVVPAGKFMMGSAEGQGADSEHPQHEVTIANPFAIGKFEVTFAEWDSCVAADGCPQVSDHGWGRGERPVINVSWVEAERYVTWLSRLTGETYRLPPEAEWEFAARAGTTTPYSFGDDVAALGEYAWYRANSDDKTHPVGEKKPNGFGLHDMYGNAREWVQDCGSSTYEHPLTDGTAWTAGDCTIHLLRGGSLVDSPGRLRSASRFGYDTDASHADGGFRVARTLTP